MLQEQSGVSSDISLAELTLVTAAPQAQIAASTRVSPGAGPRNAAFNAQAAAGEQGSSVFDVEAIADKVYRHVLLMMDIARARNGEPYL